MNGLILKLASTSMGSLSCLGIEEEELEEALYDICEMEHSSCNSDCPVYEVNGYSVPDTANDFKVNNGCDCFKNGSKMLKFIRSNL